jgi:hypothetical protein
MNDLLKLAIKGHGGLRRWEQIERFRAAASFGTNWKSSFRTTGGARPGHRKAIPMEDRT